MKNLLKKSLSVVTIVSSFCLVGLMVLQAATAVNLNSSGNFAVLAGSTITNTGSSVINGDIGLSPGTSVTGFPPGTINGTQQVANALAVQAETDLVNAYTNAAGQTPVSTIATELGGTTKTAGIYDSAAGTFGITGTLTLDGAGNANSVFIFKTASTLITAGASQVVLINGAQACNVYWQVGSSATLGANSAFKGNILALTSATLTTGANVEGRVLARNGAVTLDSNTVSKATCAAAPASTPVTPASTPVAPAPVTTTAPAVTPTYVAPAPVAAATASPTYVAPTTFPHTGIAPYDATFSFCTILILIVAVSVFMALVLVSKKQA